MRQLIFTSVLSGLDAGRSGFCTVARHASLRPRTVAELEKMSVYEPPAGTRPTVFLFRVYSGGSEPLYILTRAGDAGTDAFGRPNSIVHHLIFGARELPLLLPPAEVALRFRGWCEKFEGPPRFFSDDESLPPEILRGNGESLLPARRWKDLTGDAGNAALLCPRGDPRATIFVGDDFMTEEVLGLFAESAETLGGENAWEVAFSTGICSRSGAGRFLWRMIADGELGVRRPGDFILDFLAPLSLLRAPKTIYAEFARTGKMPVADDDGFPVGLGETAAFPTEGKRLQSALEAEDAAAARERERARESGVPAAGDSLSPTDGGDPGADVAADAAVPEKRFSDIAGTAKFLGISAIVIAVVVAGVMFWTPHRREGLPVLEVAEGVALSAPAAAVCRIVDERILEEDFAGAAEAWVGFAEAFPREAEQLRQAYFPRFRQKAAGAFAARLERRLAVADALGRLSSEDRAFVEAELAMFRRVCSELDLTRGRILKKNLAVFERAEAALVAPAPETVPAPEPRSGN